MKMKIFRTILVILLISTAILIFKFSSQNGEQSKGLSSEVTRIILERSSKYKDLDNKEKQQVFNKTNAIIRKIAHFSIYAVMGTLLMGIMLRTQIKEKWRISITLGAGIIYAIFDEIHQAFSPGRTPKITDIYIDMLGVILGILIVLIISKLYKIKTRKITI